MSSVNVAIIDSGGANINSVVFALDRLDVPARLTDDPKIIRRASHVVLPGVGSAGAAMSRLKQNQLDQLIPTLQQPVLGICLGMQLLFNSSQEDNTPCLGIVDGCVTRLPQLPGLTIPHMGWNRTVVSGENRLLDGKTTGFFGYFVHSFAVPLGDYTIGRCHHGEWFSSIVAKDNFVGIQFHPERSGEVGLQLLNRFINQSTETSV